MFDKPDNKPSVLCSDGRKLSRFGSESGPGVLPPSMGCLGMRGVNRRAGGPGCMVMG